jgi:hypothetical protein
MEGVAVTQIFLFITTYFSPGRPLSDDFLKDHLMMAYLGRNILSHVLVTKDGVWIGE